MLLAQWAALPPNSPNPLKKENQILLKHFSWFLGAGPTCKTAFDLVPLVVESIGLGVSCLHALGLSHYQK